MLLHFEVTMPVEVRHISKIILHNQTFCKLNHHLPLFSLSHCLKTLGHGVASSFAVNMGGRRLLCWPPPRYHKEYILKLCILSSFCLFFIRDKFDGIRSVQNQCNMTGIMNGVH